MQAMNRRRALALLVAAPVVLTAAPHAHARGGLSEASAAASLLSGLPVALSVTAPVMILAAGAVLTVAAVDASARGTVWVLERASDGARASVEFSLEAAGASAVAIGTVVVVTALAAGWLLSAAGEAICFVPNALGEALLYNERIAP